MAAHIIRCTTHVSRRCMMHLEHMAERSPYLFTILSCVMLPAVGIGIIALATTLVMVPVSWFMGWL